MLEIGGWCQSGNRFRFRLRCVCVCVRACEAVCGREAEVSLGARASEPKFVGLRSGPPGPGRALPGGSAVSRAKKKFCFFGIWSHQDTQLLQRCVSAEFLYPKVGAFFIEHDFFINRKKKTFFAIHDFLWNFMGHKNTGKPKENKWFSKIAKGNVFFSFLFLRFLKDHENEDHVWAKKT